MTKSKGVSEKYAKRSDEIKYLIKKINASKVGEHGKYFMKIKFNLEER